MGADLYESYVGSIIATMLLAAPTAAATFPRDSCYERCYGPLVIAAVGILASVIGTFLYAPTRQNLQQSIWHLIWD